MPEVRRAYEYTLERVGADLDSGSVWQEYLNFLAAPRPGTPAFQALFGGGPTGQEDAQRTTVLRYVGPAEVQGWPRSRRCKAV